MVSRDAVSQDYPLQAEVSLPEKQTGIQRLRQSEAGFAEICDDYELLARDLQTVRQQLGSVRSDPSAAQKLRAEQKLLVESLQGLVCEIALWLQRADPSRDAPSTAQPDESAAARRSPTGERE